MLLKIKKIFLLLITLFLFYGCGQEIVEVEKIFNVTSSASEIYIDETSTILINANMEYTVTNLTPEILRIQKVENNILTIEALAKGTGQIEIYVDDEYNKVVNINVKDYPIPTSLNLKFKEEGPFYLGETYHLEYCLEPNNALDNIYLNYNMNAMDINKETLEVKFKMSGEFYITCYSYDNMELESTIEVEVLYNPDVEFYRLLFVGNSLTQSTNNNYNIPYMVRDMMLAEEIDVICDVCVTGGASLADQKYNVESFLRRNRYTHVVLQEQSAGPIKYFDEFRESVLEISKMIEENKANLILYQTWAYDVEMWNWMTKKEMQAKLVEAYGLVAEEAGATVNRVGEAFERYESRTNLPSLYVDMNHASSYGAYLSACVHYASITGRKASGNSYIVPEMEYNMVKIIQEIADEVVFGE